MRSKNSERMSYYHDLHDTPTIKCHQCKQVQRKHKSFQCSTKSAYLARQPTSYNLMALT